MNEIKISDIKMRDVFALPISRLMRDSVGNDLDTPDILEITAISHAIHSHDKLTEQNKLLREALESIVNGENSHLILDWAICGICTNSSSGSEGRASRMKSYHDFHLDWSKAKCLIEQFQNDTL